MKERKRRIVINEGKGEDSNGWKKEGGGEWMMRS